MYNVQGRINKLENLEKFTQSSTNSTSSQKIKRLEAFTEPLPIATLSDTNSNVVKIYDDPINKVITRSHKNGNLSTESLYGLIDSSTIHLGNSMSLTISDDQKQLILNLGQFGGGANVIYNVASVENGKTADISNKSINITDDGIHIPSTSPLQFPVRRG